MTRAALRGLSSWSRARDRTHDDEPVHCRYCSWNWSQTSDGCVFRVSSCAEGTLNRRTIKCLCSSVRQRFAIPTLRLTWVFVSSVLVSCGLLLLRINRNRTHVCQIRHCRHDTHSSTYYPQSEVTSVDILPGRNGRLMEYAVHVVQRSLQ